MTFLDILLALLIAFKLAGMVDLSWWWILAPLWVQIAIFLFTFSFFLTVEAVKQAKRR